MNDFYILLFETSAKLCNVALISHTNGTISLLKAEHAGRSDQTEHILPMAARLLQQAGISQQDLSAVAFGHGPGGFTGLRVACSVAQGIAAALSIPVIAVDNMQAIAMQSAAGDKAIHVVLQDARMNEAYAAVYKDTGTDWLCLQEPILIANTDIRSWLELKVPLWDTQSLSTWLAHGTALTEFDGLADQIEALGGQLAVAGEQTLIDCMATIASTSWQAGHTLKPAQAAPLYVRDKVAFTSAERALGNGGNPRASAINAPVLHKLKLSDAPEVAAIERQVQEFPWTLQNFVSGIGTGYYGWVARSMGAMLGFALLMDSPDMLHLLVLGVHPNSQRQGVGSLLLRQCIMHCKQQKVPALTLEVRKSNQQAIDFYLQHGFQQQGVRTDYYPAAQGREDGLVMTLTIN